MKRGFATRKGLCALRFMARARRIIEAARLLIHIRQANALLTTHLCHDFARSSCIIHGFMLY